MVSAKAWHAACSNRPWQPDGKRYETTNFKIWPDSDDGPASLELVARPGQKAKSPSDDNYGPNAFAFGYVAKLQPKSQDLFGRPRVSMRLRRQPMDVLGHRMWHARRSLHER